MVDKCSESPVDGNMFCTFENIYNKNFDGNCVKSVVSRTSLACPKEIMISQEQCIIRVTKNYLIVATFSDYYSISQKGYSGSRKLLARGPIVALLSRPTEDTLYGFGQKISLIKGRSSYESELLSMKNEESSEKFVQNWLSKGEFGQIADFTNKTILHNRADYEKISNLLKTERIPEALRPIYARLKPHLPTIVICSTIIMITAILICLIRKGYITTNFVRKI